MAFRELVEAAQPLVRWWLDWKLASFDLSQPEAGPGPSARSPR